MTLNNQRIAIAKICGWSKFDYLDWYQERILQGRDPQGYSSQDVPDYLGDLNAMREAELCLTEPQRTTYIQKLIMIAQRDKPPFFHAVIASATQRAEAFLKTFDKWEDAQ